MCSEETSLLIQQTISKLENSIQNQNSLDIIYSEKKILFFLKTKNCQIFAFLTLKKADKN